MDFTILGSCRIKKNGAIFVHFSRLMSAIYLIFIYVLDDNIAYVVLFQNLGNLKTNTTQNYRSLCYKKCHCWILPFLTVLFEKERQFVQFSDFQRVISRKVAHDDIFYFLS